MEGQPEPQAYGAHNPTMSMYLANKNFILKKSIFYKPTELLAHSVCLYGVLFPHQSILNSAHFIYLKNVIPVKSTT